VSSVVESKKRKLKLQLLETSVVLMCYVESSYISVTCRVQFILGKNFSVILFIVLNTMRKNLRTTSLYLSPGRLLQTAFPCFPVDDDGIVPLNYQRKCVKFRNIEN
jgi:hypothetical protein